MVYQDNVPRVYDRDFVVRFGEDALGVVKGICIRGAL